MYSENIHRKNDDILTIAKNLSRAVRQGMTKARALSVFGLDAKTYTAYCQMAELHPTVQTAISENKIAPYAALPLADVSREEQPKMLEELLSAGEKATAKAVEAKVVEKRTGEKIDRTDEPPSKGELRKLYELDPALDISDDALTLMGILLGEEKLSALPAFSRALKKLRKGK